MVLLATDVFSTKPLWYSVEQGLRVASYRSPVVALGGSSIRQVDPNSALVDGSILPGLQRLTVHEFDLRQFKTDMVDYLSALEKAVAKRAGVSSGGTRPFIGLSPGYDSGALQVLLTLSNTSHIAYNVVCTQDVTEIEDRIAWSGDRVEGNIILLGEKELLNEVRFLQKECENFTYSGVGRQGPLAGSLAFSAARKRDLFVYLSAVGADEILSDFAFGLGDKRTVSAPPILFPEDLGSIFPWTSFFLGTQRDHLMKEELRGDLRRYPFLDKHVVQEYLWLKAAAKNDQYKAPLHQLFNAVSYPFQARKKIGFNGAYNVKVGGESLKFRLGNVGLLEQNALVMKEELSKLEKREAELQVAALEVAQFREQLTKRNEELDLEASRSDVDQMQRIQMTLFTMVPRLLVLSGCIFLHQMAWEVTWGSSAQASLVEHLNGKILASLGNDVQPHMGPPAPRRRWAPRPVDEVSSPIRPSGLPLVGTSVRRLPLAKLPALPVQTKPTKLPDAGKRPQFGLPETHVNDLEVAAELSRWLEGGQTSALRLISGLQILKDLKKPKIAFTLLKLLAGELLDVLDVSPGKYPHHPPSDHRTWLLKSLVDLLEPSIFAAEDLRKTVMQEASHAVALVEDNVGSERDTAQAMCDIVRVNQWHLQETTQPFVSAQEMWTRRSGLPPSQAPTIRRTGKEDGSLPWVAASHVQRWHCSQLLEQGRWSNEIHGSLDAQTSAAYNIMGLVRELTCGCADGWAFAFWRYQFKQEMIEMEQLQKVETSLKINREYLGILFTSWSHLAVSLQIQRKLEELNLKKLHLRMLGVRHQEAQDRRAKFEQEQVSDKSVSYMMTRKLQAAREDKSRVDWRLNTMSPADARRVLHLFMQTFMNFLADFTMTEKMHCKQKMLSKDVFFLAKEASDTIQDIVTLPCEEILCRWINCIIMETKHRASSLLTAGDVEDSRQTWQASDSQRYSKRCFEIRTYPLVETSSFEEHFKDGKLLTILYALIRAFRENSNFFDPAELAALDEKDAERRVAVALDNFSSLSPMLINRYVMKPADVLSGRLACLKSSLCSIFLREAPAIRSLMQAQSLAKALHINEKDRLPRSRRQVILPTDLPRLEDSRKRALEIQYPMAKIMHLFQDVAGRVAFADMFDLSRLCTADETIWSLSRLSLVEVLRRWVNLEVFGSAVTSFGSDLASGHILLKLMKAVAGNAIDAEDMRDEVEDCLAGNLEEAKGAMKLVIRLAKRCVPYCFLSEEVLLAGQEDVLSTLVGGLFLSWFTLRPQRESSFGQDLEGIERFLEVGLNVAAMPAEAVPESEDKSGLLDAYCKECDSGERSRLISSVTAVEEQHTVMSSLQTRMRNFIAEVMVRRVVSRRRFKSAGGDDAHTMVSLQELVRDQDWILLTENEHPATRSSRARAVVREKRVLIAKLFDYFSIGGPRGERQARPFWNFDGTRQQIVKHHV
eukprot:symbB.v1.2.003171.t1/scaffold173.1/size339812/14